jgi:hypothetical protein
MDGCRARGAAPGFRVALLGASGGIGQPLALLLKMNPHISLLHLYDVVNTPGVTADLSHVDTNTIVSSFIPIFLRFSGYCVIISHFITVNLSLCSQSSNLHDLFTPIS